MLAVNGYNETAEVVKRFVSEKKLTHPIVLMGRDVGRDQYGVEGYPTSFWVDREGRVVERLMGFGAGGEKALEAKLLDLLSRPR